MSRPPKSRKICYYPQNLEFGPLHGAPDKEQVILPIDEYEAIRLIDLEGLSQEACCERMEIARTTVQKIYESARRKLAQVLVEGRPLRIEGGSYRLCTGHDQACRDPQCRKQEQHQPTEETEGEPTMRIAVTYDNGSIFQHFGHTEFFKVYEASDGKVLRTQVVSTNGSGHGALAGVLQELKAEALICGGIGGGAQAALAQAGIRVYGGVSGRCDEAVEAYLANALAFDPKVTCSHHADSCGSHSCDSHQCDHVTE